MEKLHRDELILIGLNLSINDIFNLSETNKKLNKVFDERFWKLKVDRDYPNFINRQETFKDQYIFLTETLTNRNFEIMIEKPYILNRIINQSHPIYNLFDLLYWGSIHVNGTDKKEAIEYRFTKAILNDDLYHYRSKELDRFKSFLSGKPYSDVPTYVYEQIIEYWDVIVDSSKWIWHHDVNDYIKSLKDFEYRFQQFVIENTGNDVRRDIKETQKKWYDDLDEAVYDDEEVEFLQILHDGVKSKKLDIFDPIDFDLIMKKLKT